jgi:hypothetical protein
VTDFENLDLIIRRWSEENGVLLSESYKGEEVRSFEIVGAAGSRCQIWIEVQDSVT